MSILTKILLGLVILAVFPVLYLSAAVQNLQTKWRAVVVQRTAMLDNVKKEVEFLDHGDPSAPLSKAGAFRGPTREELNEMNALAAYAAELKAKRSGKKPRYGLDQLRVLAANAMNASSRKWIARFESATENPTTDAASLPMQNLNIAIYDPSGLVETKSATDPDLLQLSAARDAKELAANGLKKATVVYVFRLGATAADKGAYIGEFRVDDGQPDAPTDGKVLLHPTRLLSAADMAALSGTTGNPMLVVYDRMPIDEHGLYAAYDVKKIRELFPNEANQYIFDYAYFDGALPYAEEFREIYRQRVVNTQPGREGVKDLSEAEKAEADKIFLELEPLLIDVQQPKTDASGKPEYELDSDGKPGKNIIGMPRPKLIPDVNSTSGRNRKMFVRPLTDYAMLFDSYADQIAEVNTQVAAVTADIQDLQQAQKNCEAVLARLTERQKLLEDEQKIVAKELEVVKANFDKSQAALLQLTEEVQRAVNENRRLGLEKAGLSGRTASTASPDDSAMLAPASTTP